MNPRLAAGLLAALFALAACKDASAPPPSGSSASPAPATPAANGTKQVSLDAIERDAKGFSVGPAMSARVVYVFFDPQCPHCAHLWEAAKPLKSQSRFVWIPVALLNGNSLTQGAAILAAPDPAAAMEAHESSMRERQAGIIPTGDVTAQKAIVEKNTKLMDSFGFASVPALVSKQAQTGTVIVNEGAMPTDKLAQWLGIPAPTGN